MTLPSFSYTLAEAVPSGSNVTTLAQRLVGEKFDASRVNADGSVYLPGWLQVVNYTEGMTSQQSASTVASGFSAHAPRAFSTDGVTFGLLAEPATINLVQDPPDLSTWTAVGGSTVASATAPDGAAENCEVADPGGSTSTRVSNLTASPPAGSTEYTLSAWQWVTALSAGASNITADHSSGTDVPEISTSATDSGWVLREDTATTPGSPGSTNLVITPAAGGAGNTGTTRVWGVQLEARAYPTSAILPTAVDAVATRSADTIRAAGRAVWTDGYFTDELTYRPHYTESEAAGDHNLMYAWDDARLYFRQSDATFVFVVNETTLEVGPVTFSRHQEIRFRVEHSERRLRLTVTGCTTGDGDVRTDPERAVLEPTWVYLLDGPDGAEEAADLVAFTQVDRMSFCELIECRMLVQMDRDPGSRDFYEMLCAMSVERARIYDVCLALLSSFEIATAIGDQLDIIGSIVGLAREGWADATYRTYLEIQVELLLAGLRDDAEWTGTVQNILRITRKFIGEGGGAIEYTLAPPYNFKLSLPTTLTAPQIKLLMRFITTAVYGGVLGFVQFPLSGDTWGSHSVSVGTAGVWGSASAVVAGASIWDMVITTS